MPSSTETTDSAVPPVPERMEHLAQWQDSNKQLHLWGDRPGRDAELRADAPGGSRLLGTITSATDLDPDVEPDPAAVESFGGPWVERQLRRACIRLAYMWGAI